jgi:hypothetical protein
MSFDYQTIKRSTSLLLSLTFLSLLSSAQSVKADYDTKVDFTKFKTYAWLAPGDSVLNRYRHDKLYAGAINLAANQSLAAIGLKQDTENPDAIFMYYTGVEEITKYSQSPTLSVGVGVAGPGYYVAGSAPVAGGKITATTQEDGSMKFVMYDTKTQKMVWSGMAEKTFKMSDDLEKMVMDYTAKIFKKYPIKKLDK